MAREGGSYTRDPKTGKKQLVERTRQAGENPPADKQPEKKTAKGGKE